jgi:uncharacterized protein (DUF2252 family)
VWAALLLSPNKSQTIFKEKRLIGDGSLSLCATQLNEVKNSMDVIRQILNSNDGRDPELLALKYRKMRASAFTFLRGSCDLFFARIGAIDLPKNAPLVWVCGDLHLENFGSYKGDNRLVYFDVNDFDEAVLAPASWDLVRLLTSICVGTEGIASSTDDIQTLCSSFLKSYCCALANGKAYWVERDTAEGPVRTLLDKLKERTRTDLLNSRTVLNGKKRALLTTTQKALPASPAQRNQVVEFMTYFAQSQPNPNFHQVLDVARRVAGTGSLGLDRFVILVKGKGSPDGNYLLDLKLSTPSSLLPYLTVKQPRWESESHRVVALQRRNQAMPMAFLNAVHMGQGAYVLRGLQPSEDRVTISPTKHSMPALNELLVSMGKIVASMHLRSSGRQGSAIADDLIAWGAKEKWQQKMIQAAFACAQDVRADAGAFNLAYDTGELHHN